MSRPLTPPDPDRDLPEHAPHPVLAAYYGHAEQRTGFVRQLFDDTAGDYDRVERLMSFGSGAWYRRQALLRAGLQPGMRVLDVAVGTGLVAREAVAVTGDASAVVGLDPSIRMMRSGMRARAISLVQGTAEQLPFADAQFDFVSMGFALRHVADLRHVFCEFRRVLRPGGIICMLEVTAPDRAWLRRLLHLYLGAVVPLLCRVVARHTETPRLFRYFWDTIDTCVSPAAVQEALVLAGLLGVRRHVTAVIFSEYTARR